MNLKPKKKLLAIPGLGVIKREDFNQSHLNVLKGWCMTKNIPFNSIVKKHFDIELEEEPTLPLFEKVEKPKKKKK